MADIYGVDETTKKALQILARVMEVPMVKAITILVFSSLDELYQDQKVREKMTLEEAEFIKETLEL